MSKAVRLPLTQLIYGTEYKSIEKNVLDIASTYKSSDRADGLFTAALMLDSSAKNSDTEKKALNMYLQSATEGSPDAFCNIGVCYEIGRGVTADVLKAAEYYKKAIAVSEAFSGKGHFTAMSNLGAIYAEKTDSEEDGAIAFELLRSASESGEAVPLLNLALCYEHGKGCAKDILTAAYYYERSGSSGSAKALYKLGLLCITHYEMPSQKLFSVEKAVEYFERAGSMGISDAYCELADIFGSDEYGKYDEKKVITYYKKASDLGSDVAAYQLANRYLKGKGVEKDEKTALLLLKKAALRGYVPAKNQLSRLKKADQTKA